MAELQTLVLNIDKNDYIEADFMSRRFVNAETRNRAYINVLGAELFIRYLADNGYETEDIVSMHSISKVLEDVDIADVLLPNVHLDVRAIFDEDKIFIPKSHFELDITPDIYIVLKLAKNLKDAELIGYFKPSQVNKKCANDEYYFFPKEHLSTPDTLFKTLNKYKTIKDQRLDAKDFLKGRALSVGLSDHNLNNAERKELYRLMLTDSMLRDSVSEFDNFEVLSNQVATVLQERIDIKEQASKAVPGIAALTTEEILKEGIEAAITEKIAEAAEVFDTVTESVEEVKEVVETSAKLSDVFEAAPVEEPTAEVEEVQEEKITPTLEMYDPEKETEPQAQDEKNLEESEQEEKAESQTEEETSEQESNEEDEKQEDVEQAEEELALGDIDDELSLDEDMEVSDIDTLETSEVEESADEISQSEEEKAEAEETETEEVEQVEDIKEEPTEEDATAPSPEAENSEEPMLEDDLMLGDIDDELSLDEDLEVSDIDTLETSDVEESAEEISQAEEEKAEAEETETEEVEQVEDIKEEPTEEDATAPSPEAENSEEPMLEDDLMLGDIDDELLLDEDMEVSDIDTLETSDVEESVEEISQPEEEKAGTEETETEETETEEVEQVEDIKEEPTEEISTAEDAIAPSSEAENSEEPMLEDDLMLGDIDEELSLDEDIEISDVETIEPEQVQEEPSDNVSKDENIVSFENNNVQTPIISMNDYSKPIPMKEMSVDTLLDNAIAAIDKNKPEENKIGVSEAVSDNAIKMTSVAGGSVEDISAGIQKGHAQPINKPQNNDNYHADVNSMSTSDDHMSFIGGLSDAKRQANMMAEAQGLTDKPTDMSELTLVEREKQETIVHEVVDMNSIETVEREEYVEDESGIVELGTIKDVDSPTKPAANIEELDLQQVETETMELPDLNSYTINEDGTSPLDNMNWGPEEEINPDELLDLDVAETLIGGSVNIGETDYTDDLVDGSAFKSSDILYDTASTEDVSLGEDKNTEIEDTIPTEDFMEDLVIEESDSEEENPIQEANNTQVENTVENEPIEISESAEDNDINNEDDDTDNLMEESLAAEVAAQPQEQDWTTDDGYDTLADVEPTVQAEENTEDSIIEHSPATPVYNAKTNSTVISDKTFKPGEINIDINAQEVKQPMLDDDTISSLYERNSEVATNTILNNPGRLTQQKQKSSGGLAAGLSIVGALVVFVLLFAFGFGVSKFLKGPVDETPQPISEDGGEMNNNVAQQEAQPTGQVVEMDNNTNALASTAGTTPPASPGSFVEVKKLSWEVPGTVSADPNFQQYFQSAGKSLKSALMTDLLAVSDKAYASEMRVSITYNQDGTFRDARIVTASGSNQIDNIVLRTVNQTLNVLKAPRSVGSYENTTAVLKIYL